MGFARYPFAALLAASIVAAPAQAQGNIFAGQTVNGRLDTSDYLRDDGTYYDDWFYEGRAGETITVTQSSSDFDSWLLLGRVSGGEFRLDEFNDDGAGGNDARITYTLPSSGRYVIRANVVGRGRTGSYSLSIRSGALQRAPVSSSVEGAVGIDQSVTGTLDSSDPTMTDGTYYELWRFSGEAGQRVRITMRSSDFDAYMTIGSFTSGDYAYIEGDDDGAGGNDAMIEYTLPASGVYGIRANSMGKATGRYTITVQSF